MRVTVLTGIICAVVFIIVKMIFFYTQPVGYDVTALVLINLFLLIVAIGVGLFLQKMRDTEESTGLRDIKNGMTAGVPYAVIIGIFLYFYYEKIDPEFNQHKLAEQEYLIDQQLNKPGGLEEIKKDNPDFEVLSKEEIKEQAMDSARGALSSTSTMTLTLLGLIVMSAMNSIFITIIYRRVVFRTPNKPQTREVSERS
jgi:magnesium-transporting ATPase (P-type)